MSIVSDILKNIKLGEPISHLNAVVLPLCCTTPTAFEYLTMDEAMKKRVLSITEASESGSVSRLTAINFGEEPVLLLDGEELLGGRQNRALNTTILVKERSQITIPVSCTEHARWSMSRGAMISTDAVMPWNMRVRRLESVSASLRARGTFGSNQRNVWRDAADLQSRSLAQSSSVSDIFRARAIPLDRASEAIPAVPHQTGLLVLLDDAVIGFDLLSSARAYAQLHSKLIKSYLLQAILARSEEVCDLAGATKKGMTFLDEVAGCEQREFPSIGWGNDWRFSGNTITGIALIHDGCVVHTFFSRRSTINASRPFERRPNGFTRLAWLHPKLTKSAV